MARAAAKTTQTTKTAKAAHAAADDRLTLPHVDFNEDLDGLRLTGHSCGPCAFDASSPTNHPHVHTCYELCVVCTGSGRYEHGGEQYALAAGDVFIADPGVCHEISSFETLDLDLVFFVFEVFGQTRAARGATAGLAAFVAHHRVHVPGQDHILELVRAINVHLKRSSLPYWLRHMTRQLLLESMEALSERPLFVAEEEDAPLEQTVDLAVRYIRSRARERPRLDDVAAACGVSGRNLEMLFRRNLDSTVIGYINTERMRVAANDLLMGYRVQEVSERLGVPSPEQFSRMFKKHHGVSPKQYQVAHAPSRAGYGVTFRLSR